MFGVAIDIDMYSGNDIEIHRDMCVASESILICWVVFGLWLILILGLGHTVGLGFIL